MPPSAVAAAAALFGVQTARRDPPAISAPYVGASEPEAAYVHYVAHVCEDAPKLDEPIATEPRPDEPPSVFMILEHEGGQTKRRCVAADLRLRRCRV